MDAMRTIGATGEAAVMTAFLRLGVPVYVPLVDVGADIVADFGGKLQKVQVKTCSSKASSREFCLGARKRKGWEEYAPGTVDWYALHFTERGYTALVPADIKVRNVTISFDGGGTFPLEGIDINNVIKNITEEH